MLTSSFEIFRLNNLQPDLLRKLSRMSDFKAPSNANDLIPRRVTFPTEFSTNDVDIWRSLNLSGRREGPLYVEEPDFVVRGESENHAQLFGTYFFKDNILCAVKGVIDFEQNI